MILWKETGSVSLLLHEKLFHVTLIGTRVCQELLSNQIPNKYLYPEWKNVEYNYMRLHI